MIDFLNVDVHPDPNADWFQQWIWSLIPREWRQSYLQSLRQEAIEEQQAMQEEMDELREEITLWATDATRMAFNDSADEIMQEISTKQALISNALKQFQAFYNKTRGTMYFSLV